LASVALSDASPSIHKASYFIVYIRLSLCQQVVYFTARKRERNLFASIGLCCFGGCFTVIMYHHVTIPAKSTHQQTAIVNGGIDNPGPERMGMFMRSGGDTDGVQAQKNRMAQNSMLSSMNLPSFSSIANTLPTLPSASTTTSIPQRD
jgi:hypothetical protein